MKSTRFRTYNDIIYAVGEWRITQITDIFMTCFIWLRTFECWCTHCLCIFSGSGDVELYISSYSCLQKGKHIAHVINRFQLHFDFKKGTLLTILFSLSRLGGAIHSCIISLFLRAFFSTVVEQCMNVLYEHWSPFEEQRQILSRFAEIGCRFESCFINKFSSLNTLN